jgi:DNA-binding response OmpR family regulator
MKNILVVDDDAYNRTIIANILLKNTSYQVFSASKSAQVFKLLKQYAFDLIILDWQFEGEYGINILKKIKLNNEWTEIPVIIYTGVMTTSHHLADALEAGAIEFLRKPVDEYEIKARISSILNLKDLQAEIVSKCKQQIKLEIQQLKNEIEIKCQEVAGASLESVYLKNRLKYFQSELKKIVSSEDIVNKHLAAIIRQINKEIKQDNYWEKFNLAFSQVHFSFYANIQQKYPSISKSELKYLALLKLNYSGKDISTILNITSSGVEKIRYRIKKKIVHDFKESLEKFVMIY